MNFIWEKGDLLKKNSSEANIGGGRPHRPPFKSAIVKHSICNC